jgi:hypothetical protein
MKITLIPQRRDDLLVVLKEGDKLLINDDECDFSKLPDGATLPADAISNPWIVGDVERINGELHISLLLPHGPYASQSVCFPTPLFDPADGFLELPQ